MYQHQATPEDKMIRNYVAFLSPAVFLAPSEQLPNSLPPWLISSVTNQPFPTKLAKHHVPNSPKWDLLGENASHLPTPLRRLDHNNLLYAHVYVRVQFCRKQRVQVVH